MISDDPKQSLQKLSNHRKEFARLFLHSFFAAVERRRKEWWDQYEIGLTVASVTVSLPSDNDGEVAFSDDEFYGSSKLNEAASSGGQSTNSVSGDLSSSSISVGTASGATQNSLSSRDFSPDVEVIHVQDQHLPLPTFKKVSY